MINRAGELPDPTTLGDPGSRELAWMRGALASAAPALGAFVAIKVLGLVVLNAFANNAGRDAHRLLVWWDGQWYEGIAQNGYGPFRVHPDGRIISDYAFFPLYPFLEKAVAEATGLPYVDAGLLISWLASLFAAWGIFAVAKHLYDAKVGLLATVLWAALPFSVVQSMAYSESLFTALAAWSLYAVVSDRWLSAGFLACLTGITRPTGAAVVAAVAITALLRCFAARRSDVARSSKGSPRLRLITAAAIAPLGWFGYVGWVGWRTGAVTGYFQVTEEWGNGFDGGITFARWIWGFLASRDFLLGVTICVGIALLGWLSWWCVRGRQPFLLLIYSGILVLVALTTSGYFGSKPRYLLPAFPLLFPIALWLGRQRVPVVISTLGLMVASSAVYGGFWLTGAGPP